jgi:hypothetical protein
MTDAVYFQQPKRTDPVTHDSTRTMRLIHAVEDSMEAAKGKKATMFLTALHEKGFKVEPLADEPAVSRDGAAG